MFRPHPAIPVKYRNEEEARSQFRFWQRRVLVYTIGGYALFYFVRQNLPMAMPDMIHRLGLNKQSLGTLLTLNGVLYGISKFANGFLGDRTNARALMVVGLIGSALFNICFGLSSTVFWLGLFWLANGWFQGMGFPPCARLMTHWFPPKKLATKMSIWNCSHSLGALLIVVLCGYLVERWGWRSCFLVPAGIALAGAGVLWLRLPDTPPSVGLPEVHGTGIAASSASNSFVWRQVFRNKYIWMVSFSNFFVYTIRYAVFNWGPTLLTEVKHLRIVHVAWMMAGFECAGLVGALVSGWMTDRFFKGLAMRVSVFYMLCAGLALFLFWQLPRQNELTSALLLSATGFFIYGPQCLVSIAAANLATKRAAATAIGLTSIFGYASTVLSGTGLGWMVLHHGWDAVFTSLMVIAILGVISAAVCWFAPADGYEK